MHAKLALLTAGVATAFALAASAIAAPPSVQVTIRHQVRGCHAWAVDGGRYLPTQRLTTNPGAIFTFVDNDVMPHHLVQRAGPKGTSHAANMNRPGASASLQVFAKGRYVFRTRAGEDYMSGMKTIGADNALLLVVTVR
jgi:plastocyanin